MASGKEWDGDGVPLKDSNCAGIGGAEDKALRKKAAATEPAWQGGVGAKPGVLVWRIEGFKVVPWDTQRYGQFHKGDSYIILDTELNDRKLEHHIFFWLGESTSTDEMGTAAYKTVELDDYFDGSATQSREVQGQESKQFLSLFPKVTYIEGGVASGFHHVENAATYEARLYSVRKVKGRGVIEQEVVLERASLNEGDCFVLDAGAKLYIYHGPEAVPLEKYEANTMAERLEVQRNGHAEATHELDSEFWRLLGGEGPVKPASEGTDRVAPPDFGEGVLFRLTDAGGKLHMEEVGRRNLSKSMLVEDDVMILDHGAELFIWVGKGADDAERRNAFRTAIDFLKMNNRDTKIPIHMYKQGNAIKNKIWNDIFKD